MVKLNFASVQILLLVFGFSQAIEDPQPLIEFTNIETKVNENPYFSQNWGVIIEDKDVLTIDCPVLADVPENMMMKFIINAPLRVPIEHETLLCEAFDDEFIAKNMMECGRPKNFPKSCTIHPGDNYRIKSWKVPVDKLPASLIDGVITGKVLFYEPEKKPYVEIDVTAKIYRKK